MLRTPNFGRKSLNEIKEVLSSMGLRLGMVRQAATSPGRGCRLRGSMPLHHPGWPPENIEEVAKKLDMIGKGIVRKWYFRQFKIGGVALGRVSLFWLQ